MTIQQHNPMHPGVFIKRVYIKPFNIGSDELASKLFIKAELTNSLLNGEIDISPTMALKLSKVLGRSPESWLFMQDNYNLWLAKKEIDLDQFEAISFAA